MTSKFAIEMFYDGDCPLCLRETNFIRRLDRNRRVCFTNIASPDFDPSSTGKAYHELMAEIHGRLPTSAGAHRHCLSTGDLAEPTSEFGTLASEFAIADTSRYCQQNPACPTAS